ncbi:MAG: hypothetical protein ACK4JE_01745, partial [Endomicrobiia bacterium]
FLSEEIGKIFFIHKSKKLEFKKINSSDIIRKLMKNVLFFSSDTYLVYKLMDIFSDISKKVSCYEMYFPKDFDRKFLEGEFFEDFSQ